MEIENDLVKKFNAKNCIPVTCADVKCVFEFVGYLYCGGQELLDFSRSPLPTAKLKHCPPPPPDDKSNLLKKRSNSH